MWGELSERRRAGIGGKGPRPVRGKGWRPEGSPKWPLSFPANRADPCYKLIVWLR
jgi:hypothetical protein